MIVVQRVVTSWTKQSRGGAAATRRNAVPEAFTLPAGGESGVLIHEVDVRENGDFAPVSAVRTLERLPDADRGQLAESGWGSPRLAADQGIELHLAVAGVDVKTRDAMAICASVDPVTRGCSSWSPRAGFAW